MIEDVEVPEGWRRVRLGEIGKIISGSTPNTSRPDLWNGDIVWVTPDDLSRLGGKHIETSARKISSKGLKNCSARLIPPNSIVISSRAPIGYLAISKNTFTTNQGCKSISLYQNYNSDFIYYCLHLYTGGMLTLSSGTTFNEISKTGLEKLKIIVPSSLSEQRKIAEILETVDNAIERTDSIIEKYKRVKQGLMQDLLTIGVVANDELGVMNYELRDGKKHRFKDYPPGRIPEEWEVVEIYEICNIINGGTPKTEKTEYWNGDIPWLSVEDFNTGKRWVVSSTKYITELGLKKSATRLLRKGMLIISARGSVGVIAQLGCDMAFNQTSYGLDSKDKSHITNDFLYYALKHYINSFLSLAYGNVFDTITRDTFKETKIPIPPLSEQHRIASVLSQMDQTIEKEQKYKQKLESIKQGLMEDLLTGKVRVNHLIKEGMENVQPA